jgi:hypothetical protein
VPALRLDRRVLSVFPNIPQLESLSVPSSAWSSASGPKVNAERFAITHNLNRSQYRTFLSFSKRNDAGRKTTRTLAAKHNSNSEPKKAAATSTINTGSSSGSNGGSGQKDDGITNLGPAASPGAQNAGSADNSTTTVTDITNKSGQSGNSSEPPSLRAGTWPHFFSKDAIVAKPGYNRWLVVPASFMVQGCVGSVRQIVIIMKDMNDKCDQLVRSEEAGRKDNIDSMFFARTMLISPGTAS